MPAEVSSYEGLNEENTETSELPDVNENDVKFKPQ